VDEMDVCSDQSLSIWICCKFDGARYSYGVIVFAAGFNLHGGVIMVDKGVSRLASLIGADKVLRHLRSANIIKFPCTLCDDVTPQRIDTSVP
jgi:hypothetical protein